MNEMAQTPAEPATEGVAFAGEKLPEGTPPATEEAVIEALKTIYDPEIPVDIYQLGLIYGLKIEETGDIAVTMTLTAPSCPVAGALPQQVADRVSVVPGAGEVKVALVWEPPWTMANMSEDARLALNLY
jgi:FeS assembly SUF system protein